MQEIWSEYDDDNSGSLDKEETRHFIDQTLGGISGKVLSDDEFDDLFKEFDADGSGTIEKNELRDFIKRITGLD